MDTDMTIVNGISRIGYMTGGRSALWIDENIADVITARQLSLSKTIRINIFSCTSQPMTYMFPGFQIIDLPVRAGWDQGEMHS